MIAEYLTFNPSKVTDKCQSKLAGKSRIFQGL